MAEEEMEKPTIVGSIKMVVCAECNRPQSWNEIMEQGHCTSEKKSRGWEKCFSTSFLEMQ